MLNHNQEAEAVITPFERESKKITIPRHKPIGRIYIEMVRKLIKEEENDEKP